LVPSSRLTKCSVAPYLEGTSDLFAAPRRTKNRNMDLASLGHWCLRPG
jgi:hypothetical protein